MRWLVNEMFAVYLCCCWPFRFQPGGDMKVKDQIRVRREQLGVSVNELAKRLGVSSQAIRHWENGRSFPGKSKTNALEVALSFNVDWTEGSRVAAKRSQISGLIDPNDVSLLLQIAHLPPPAKALISDLVEMHLKALNGGELPKTERIKEIAARPFNDKEESNVEKETPSAKRTRHHHQARRKAA
jgi:transcriptional regulator with XRE-family HTH domain